MCPIVDFIAAEPGLAQRLLAEHADDGAGRCGVCSEGGQAGRYRWPCSIYTYARRAFEVQVEHSAVVQPADRRHAAGLLTPSPAKR